MATGSAYEWDITEPKTDTGAVTDGAAEIRYLKAGVSARLETDHLVPQDTASGTVPYGGEHFLGSARCFVGTSNPLYMPYGGASASAVFTEREFDTTEGTLDAGGSWDNATGRMFFDTGDSENSLSVLTAADGAGANTWTEIGYLKYSGTTTTVGQITVQSDATVTSAFEYTSAFTVASDATTTLASTAFSVQSSRGGAAIALGLNTVAAVTYSSGVHLHLGMSIAGSRPEGHICFEPITYAGSGSNFNITPTTGNLILTWTAGNLIAITSPAGSRVDEYVALCPASTGGAGSAGAGNQYFQLRVGGNTYKVLHDGTV